MSIFRVLFYKHLLFLICVFFLATRIYKISEIPVSVYWDEASIGYNAYSILKTGHDEWGQFLPLDFKAFGEYKLPVYIYSVIPFVYFFGLNEISIRLPSVLFSLGVVIATFFFVKQISQDKIISLISAFLITVSQWLFIFSRTGYEATAGLFFFMAGLYFFISAKDGVNRFSFLLSPVSFVLSLYSYNSFRLITPVTIFILVAIFHKKLLKNFRNNLFINLIVLAILLIGFFGLFKSLFIGNSLARLDEIGISVSYNQKKYEVIPKLISNYFSHFSSSFLLNGDINPRSQQPGLGQINFLYIPFFILGIIYIFNKKRWEYYLILILFLLSFLPPIITTESPHALRSITVIPFIAIVTAFGIFKLGSFFKKKTYCYTVITIGFMILYLGYYGNFLTVYSKNTAVDWQYPYKVIYQDPKIFDNFDQVIISDRYGQPYIFALFYLQYDPIKFRNEVENNQSIRKETSVVKRIGKLNFTNIDFYQFPKGKSLVFAHPSERMDEIKYKSIVYNPDGSIGWYVYEYQK